ncbi:NADH-quinone oxidoreductase subunit L [Hahella sp. SMD15-11]|uniref:Probable inorganic carbon transporter subunit DabB n=1 Tax=Thermohahella caldifontis TaxID=3142973 RepID=A0AB39UTY1_9GAMM
MALPTQLTLMLALAPALIMAIAALRTLASPAHRKTSWDPLIRLSVTALVFTLLQALLISGGLFQVPVGNGWVRITPVSPLITVLVQILGTVIAFNSRTSLADEPRQRRYISGLAWVLTAVHLLLIADHWVLFIGSWAMVGLALNILLCFYPERPFALLAAHKKQIADWMADILLVSAAILAWQASGSGSLSGLMDHVATRGMTPALQVCAVLVVLAAVLRTALLPVHGWLIQVMEAPTPVSALMHAGVVNLSAAVLVRFAPLLEASEPARLLLTGSGLLTAVLAGMVLLTRISIKVRLAWSTCAQMGFMLLEIGLGLYTLAILHLIGHSLYKAHAFLSASSAVRQTQYTHLRGTISPRPVTYLLAPALSIPIVLAISLLPGFPLWPWWWSVALGFNWAPLLWVDRHQPWQVAWPVLAGRTLLTTGLAALAWIFHAPLAVIEDQPDHASGMFAAAGLACLYGILAGIHLSPHRLEGWRRACYAGFYLDEYFTRFALRIWPRRWVPDAATAPFVRFGETERTPGGLPHV